MQIKRITLYVTRYVTLYVYVILFNQRIVITYIISIVYLVNIYIQLYSTMWFEDKHIKLVHQNVQL